MESVTTCMPASSISSIIKEEKYEMNTDEVQSVWGSSIPKELLHKIFEHVLDRECLPTICNLGKVCQLWYDVSSNPVLWHTVDVGTWTRQKCRNDSKLQWIIRNRLSKSRMVNLDASNWKIKDIGNTLKVLHSSCPGLNGIGLSSWKKLTGDHLEFIVKNFQSLRKLDLSSINVSLNVCKLHRFFQILLKDFLFRFIFIQPNQLFLFSRYALLYSHLAID